MILGAKMWCSYAFVLGFWISVGGLGALWGCLCWVGNWLRFFEGGMNLATCVLSVFGCGTCF